MAPEPRSPLGALAPADFLARHWQRAPLLVRDALPDLGGLLTPDDLAGIACDPEALARLVIRTKDSWEVRHGPFDEEDFGRLPRRGWSLLVSCVDAWVPTLALVTRRLGFLPAWRFDDCMVSYAPEGGGVGPHVDQYDVFLVQLAGRRRWSVGGPAGGFRPGLPLRILEAFAPTERWDLGPGDMLYLPPGTAHDGVSLDDDCLTLSIGFRAPSAADLLATLAQGLAEREDARFADAGRAPAEHRLAITEADLDRTQALLRSAVEDRDAVADALARLVTEPRLDPPDSDSDRMLALAQVIAETDTEPMLRPDARLALLPRPDGRFEVYAEGRHAATTDADGADLLARLAEGAAGRRAEHPVLAPLRQSSWQVAYDLEDAAETLAEREDVEAD